MAASELVSQTPAALSGDVLDKAADAVLRLATEGPWRDLTLRDIAAAAEVPLGELYARTPGKAELLDRISLRFDQAALGVADDPGAEIGDRLFEAIMARLEAMEPHRFALIAILRDEGRLNGRLALRLASTGRALLEGAGVDTGGRRGPIRVVAMTGIWVRILQVWRDDEGALNRTMAEIDKRLKQMRKRLGQIGAGF